MSSEVLPLGEGPTIWRFSLRVLGECKVFPQVMAQPLCRKKLHRSLSDVNTQLFRGVPTGCSLVRINTGKSGYLADVRILKYVPKVLAHFVKSGDNFTLL